MIWPNVQKFINQIMSQRENALVADVGLLKPIVEFCLLKILSI